MLSRGLRSERGASAILVAASLVLLIGFGAIAIDVSAGMNERRQDQTAADVGVMAGAVEGLVGAPQVAKKVVDFVELNLDTTYSAGDWQALWESCVDPAAERNAGGYTFVALDAPYGWSPSQPGDWCVSFDSSERLLRVRVPTQIVETTFGRVLGSSELQTHAVAISRLKEKAGSVRPFGLTSTVGSGEQVCLSSGPTGLSTDPCEGAESGNFGVLKARLFGSDEKGTAENCNASPLGDVLAVNIALGFDHTVVLAPDADPANEVRDLCWNPFVNTLNTDTGFPNNGLEQGLVGPMPSGQMQAGYPDPTPLLFQPTPERETVAGYSDFNDTPLWSYLEEVAEAWPEPDVDTPIDYGGMDTPGDPDDDAPLSCDPDEFDDGLGPMDYDGDGVDDDYDGDGNVDLRESFQHMQRCFDDYVDGGYEIPVFGESLASEPRFGYVPQFFEDNLGSGNDWRHIKRFRVVYIQGTWWKKGTDWISHHPGEACSPCTGGGTWSLKQISGLVIPDEMLPSDLRGDPPPGAIGLQPFDVELYR